MDIDKIPERPKDTGVKTTYNKYIEGKALKTQGNYITNNEQSFQRIDKNTPDINDPNVSDTQFIDDDLTFTIGQMRQFIKEDEYLNPRTTYAYLTDKRFKNKLNRPNKYTQTDYKGTPYFLRKYLTDDNTMDNPNTLNESDAINKEILEKKTLRQLKQEVAPEDWTNLVLLKREQTARYRKQIDTINTYGQEIVDRMGVKNEGLLKALNADQTPNVNLDRVAERIDLGYKNKNRRINSTEIDIALKKDSEERDVPAFVIQNQNKIDSTVANSPVLGFHESSNAMKQRAIQARYAIENFDKNPRGNKRDTFRLKDKKILYFMSIMKYVTVGNISAFYGGSIKKAQNELNKLLRLGLVHSTAAPGVELWIPSKSGFTLAGAPKIRRITNTKQIAFGHIPHQVTINHIAANVWNGNVNVLYEDDFPNYWRKDENGQLVKGSEIISEGQIRSSSAMRIKNQRALDYNKQMAAIINNQFTEWRQNAPHLDSPEFWIGNEFMFTLWPGENINKAIHYPDLVIPRKRNPDLTPNSIAIEVELGQKEPDSLQATLEAYAAETTIYKKVIWVVTSNTVARTLEKLSKNTTLFQDGRITIIPVIGPNGKVWEKELWYL